MQLVLGPLMLTVSSPDLDAIGAQLAKLQVSIDALTKESTQEMEALDDKIASLTSQVASNTTVIGSATTLINGFAAQLAAAVSAAQAAGATPAQLQSLTDLQTTIAANDTALATAIAANTPAAPAPAPAPSS
jgi:hypothetical protein